MNVHHTCLQRGDEPEHDAGHERQPNSECHYSPIETYFTRTRNSIRTYVKNEFDTPLCDQHSERAADQSQQNAFGEQLTSDAPASRAHRCANSHFLLTGLGPRQQQVCDIRARNQQHKSYGCKQDPERPANVQHKNFKQRRDAFAIARVGIVVLLFEVRADGVHVSFCLRETLSRLKTRSSVQARMIATLLPTRLAGELTDRHPHLDPAGKLKIRWHDSDDRVALSVQSKRL